MESYSSQILSIKFECARLGIDIKNISKTESCSLEEAYRLRLENILLKKKLESIEAEKEREKLAHEREIEELKTMMLEQDKEIEEKNSIIMAVSAEPTGEIRDVPEDISSTEEISDAAPIIDLERNSDHMCDVRIPFSLLSPEPYVSTHPRIAQVNDSGDNDNFRYGNGRLRDRVTARKAYGNLHSRSNNNADRQ